MSLIEPQGNTGDMYKGEKVAAGFFISSGDRAKAFEVVKEDFNQVSPPVVAARLRKLSRPRRLRCDNRLHSTLADRGAKGVGIVAGICDEYAAFGVSQQIVSSDHVVPMSRREGDIR